MPSGEVILKKPIDPNDFEITIPDAVGLPGVYDDDCCDFQIDGFDEKVVILCDENSNEIKFDFLDLVPYRGKEYVVLLPVSDKADEVVILQLEEADDETESYISVDNLIIDPNGIKENRIIPYTKSSAEAIGKFLCSNWSRFQAILDYTKVNL